MRLRLVLVDWLHETIDNVAGVDDRELREEEAELLVISLGETSLHVSGEVPKSLLEWADRLFSRLVEELFIRVARLPLILRVLAQPIVNLIAQRF